MGRQWLLVRHSPTSETPTPPPTHPPGLMVVEGLCADPATCKDVLQHSEALQFDIVGGSSVGGD